MIAIVPIITGIALGLTVPRRTAIIAQAVLYVVAAAVIIATAHDHGASTAEGALFALALFPVAAVSLVAGLVLRSRRSDSSATRTADRADATGTNP